ncbi:hypothetical protein [Sphingomonas sp. Leaf242]|uniref:hypothetical protein n=1 Tax=Sphingomonas sp. Leaf242 TaxID=1736304 RepID=UPI0012E2FB00|nr:hypothetical protein [Sphingomonas sp. Leaf242]
MSSRSPHQTQRDVLHVLFDRATKGHRTDPSLTRPRISELLSDVSKVKLSPAVLQIHLDDLLSQGLVGAPKRGVRDRFQITAQGIQSMDAEIAATPSSINSESWTGSLDRTSITDSKRVEIIKRIKNLQAVVEDSDLTNSEKSQAGALIAASITMAEAPSPPWESIKELMILIASISTVLTLALEIAKMIS